MKIVEFSQKLPNIKERCKASFKSGNFLLCLKYAFMALNSFDVSENASFDTDFYVYIADCYYSLGAYNIALEWYNKALRDKKNKTACFIGLTRCYLELKKYELAFFYVNNAFKTDKKGKYSFDLESLGLYMQSDAFLSKINNKGKVFIEVNSFYVEQAKIYLASNRINEAKDILNKVSTKSQIYFSALNLLSTISFIENDLLNCQLLAEQSLQLKNNNIGALCNLALCYNARGNKVASMSVMKQAMANKDMPTTEKLLIATTLCQLNAHKLVIVYIQDILEKEKFNFDFLILLAIAYNNIKDYKNALKTIDFCLDFYKENAVCLYLKNKILQCEISGNTLPYINQIYVADDISFLSRQIEEEFSKTEEELKKYVSNLHNIEQVYWALKTLGNQYANMIFFNLIRANCIDFMKELLLSSNINVSYKLSIIKEFILQNKLEKLPIIFEGVYSEINVKKIKEKLEHSDNFQEIILKEMGMEIIN